MTGRGGSKRKEATRSGRTTSQGSLESACGGRNEWDPETTECTGEETSWSLKKLKDHNGGSGSDRCPRCTWVLLLFKIAVKFNIFGENEPFLAWPGKGKRHQRQSEQWQRKSSKQPPRSRNSPERSFFVWTLISNWCWFNFEAKCWDHWRLLTQARWRYPPSDGDTRKCLSKFVYRGLFFYLRTSWCQAVFLPDPHGGGGGGDGAVS